MRRFYREATPHPIERHPQLMSFIFMTIGLVGLALRAFVSRRVGAAFLLMGTFGFLLALNVINLIHRIRELGLFGEGLRDNPDSLPRPSVSHVSGIALPIPIPAPVPAHLRDQQSEEQSDSDIVPPPPFLSIRRYSA
ncbi:MAG TPA: hypothetical protein VD770_02765 [Coxiellaceae bacterium]|nr:hypothetical protein [Coxiellaceae bacterium]